GIFLALTPLDIHNKEFTRSFRGYDEDEVNNYLDQIIKDYELTIREKHDLQNKVNEMEERLKHFSEIEETLNKSIVIDQITAEGAIASARKEATLISTAAEKNADRIVEEGLSKSRNMSRETEDLHRQTKVFRTRLKMLIEAQLDMINNQHLDGFLSSD